MDIHVYAIDLDIPLIIGLCVLNSQRLLVNYIDNSLHFCNQDIKQPFTYKFGHLFCEWDLKERFFFSREELNRLHLHFMHPSYCSLLDLITRSDLKKATPPIRKMLESITDKCSTCRSFRSVPEVQSEHAKGTLNIQSCYFNLPSTVRRKATDTRY